jgi:toxin ParE1/3/4
MTFSFLLNTRSTPGIGRVWTEKRPFVRRVEHRKHVVMYRVIDDGILILRILHQSMMPEQHPLK